MEDLDAVVIEGPTLALSHRADQDRHVLVVGEHRVELELEGPARKLPDLLELTEDRLLAEERSRELVLPGSVPHDVVVEQVVQRGHITGGERRESLTDQVLVRMSHHALPCSLVTR